MKHLEDVYQERQTKYKYSKEVYLTLRNTIKILAKLQRSDKIFRYSDKGLGDIIRLIPQSQAQSEIAKRSNVIKLLHILYDEVRSKVGSANIKRTKCDNYELLKLDLLSKQYLTEGDTKTL